MNTWPYGTLNQILLIYQCLIQKGQKCKGIHDMYQRQKQKYQQVVVSIMCEVKKFDFKSNHFSISRYLSMSLRKDKMFYSILYLIKNSIVWNSIYNFYSFDSFSFFVLHIQILRLMQFLWEPWYTQKIDAVNFSQIERDNTMSTIISV